MLGLSSFYKPTQGINTMENASRKNLMILSFTLLIVMLGYGMVMPIMPFYIELFGAGGTELGWLMSTYSLMQLLCAPLWGTLSDRYGRKPILSIGVFGYAIALFLLGLAQNFAMLFLARSLSGILSSATMPTAMAYISDNAPQEEKSKGMGQLGAMAGVGVIFGPIMGGYLSTSSLSLPFFVGSGLAFLSLLLVFIFLPETRIHKQGTKGQTAVSSALYKSLLFSPAGVLLLLIFIMSFGLTNFQGMIGLYVVDKFAFDTQQVGAIWMVMGIMLIVVQGGLTGPLSKKIGELMLIRLGLFGGALGFVFVALAINYGTILLALGLFIAALALIGPALNAYISRFAGEHQGAVMGMNSAVNSLGRVLGPFLGGYLFDLNIDYPFWSGAATLAVGLIVSFLGVNSTGHEAT